MRKVCFTFLTTLVLVVAMSSSVFAAGWLSLSDVALGGVTLEMTQNAVANIYGQPSTSTDRGVSRMDGCRHVIWKYGDSFVIDFADGSVDTVQTDANNGIQTPAGIHVGSSENDIWSAYGEPWFRQGNGGRQLYWYHTEKDRKLFIAVSNGRVTKIAVAYE
ncbi:MAG: hypothetical protein SPL39_11545 [Selenomonadaceae bacterium]|nr:hypothetical protein [Selenomonadaceae bacterium]